MEEALVFYPSPHIGHLISMVELGKLILNHRPSISIHILITTPPYNPGDTAPYIASVSSTTPIIFHRLPTISLPPSFLNSSTHHENLTFEVLRLNKPDVLQSLISISKNFDVKGFVMDLFCGIAYDVPVQLNIPALFFFTSGAGCLIGFLCLPTIHRTTTKSLKDLHTPLEFPGLPPIPASDMAKPLLDRDDKAYHCFLEGSINLAKSAGIIINTFEFLEPRPIKAVRDGLCVPDGIGHLISMVELGKLILTHHPRFSITVLLITTPPKRTNITPNSTTQQQATNSVAQYIAAVSATTPSINFHHLPQVSLPPDFNRSTPDTGFELPRYNNPNLHHALLTISKTSKLKAFLIDFFCDAAFEVAAEQLKIPTYYFFTSSASGLAVFLKIPTIDSNISIDIPNLPSIPFSSWPDPLVDRTTTVYKNFSKTATHGFVSAAELERRVRELMDSEKGREVRDRVLGLRDSATAAMKDDGSSRAALNNLTEQWSQN
ncbi:hypothetical protein FEM48_Zijuj03G0165000 [Ziziphus jujuba var. spinosa]|uniref:Uncharacterized protein n=1 Tax=Ziziphus jujuba var. spinosa TaxID=714518 RepID=A0A978VRE1_ZIZJJ|nr:hypothetical protein FEM48_Zijuj03G0165000 [Ziziphus jujuba var. spinosa]